MVFIGLDVGSSGSKCVAFDAQGKNLSMKYMEYNIPSGTLNLSPELLEEAVFSVISSCVAEIEHKSDIKSITVSSFGESFVPISDAGKPLSDIIMYFADKAGTELDSIVKLVGENEIMSTTRTKPATMFALPKMMWTEKNIKEPVWKYLSIANYISFLLTGETTTDYSLACRTLLFDVNNLKWSDRLLDAACIKIEQMPEIVPCGFHIGTVLSKIASQLGLPSNVSVIVGAQDQVVNALGAGVLTSSDAVIGTGTVECLAPKFDNMPSLEFTQKNYVCIPYFDGYVTYAFNFSGGSLVKWFRETLAVNMNYDQLNAGCPSKPTGIYLIPHFQGAGGTPDMVKNARGLTYGLSLSNNIFDIYRAVLEGITFEMAYNLDTLKDFAISPQRLFASGGGARSKKWLQIKADIVNRTITPVAEEECGALGSVMLAAISLGCCKDESEAVQLFVKYKETVTPNEQNAAIYREMFNEYKSLRNFSLTLAGAERSGY